MWAEPVSVRFPAVRLYEDQDVEELVRFLIKHAKSWAVTSTTLKPYADTLKLVVNGFLVKYGTWLVARNGDIQRLTDDEFAQQYRVSPADPWANVPPGVGVVYLGPGFQTPECTSCPHPAKVHSLAGCVACRCGCSKLGVASTRDAVQAAHALRMR